MGLGRRLAASLVLLAAATSAQGGEAYEMRIGRPVAAPLGYEAFCRREPQDCAPAAKAAASYWGAAFGSRRSGEAVAPSSIRRSPWASGEAASSPGRAKLTDERRATLERINGEVNRNLISATDWKIYGRRDYWALPLSRPGRKRGDCEDYVMEKRHQLLAAGFSMAQLSVALVRTRWGETHAVLLVETDEGALVLDNRRDAIRPWRRVKDRWIMRQSPADPGAWVSIQAPPEPGRRGG